MNIFTVTSHFFDDIAELFSEDTVRVLPNNYSSVKADLIIFSGGSDINPERYGRENEGRSSYDNPRDVWELKVFNDIIDGKLKTKKILGLCRGLQLINVGMGGNLIQDIPTSHRKAHPYVHSLAHCNKHPLSFLKQVNSMHHQGISYIGQKYQANVLATFNDIIEIISWHDTFLGVQFHPEFFPNDLPEKVIFVSAIKRWIEGKITFSEQPRKEIKMGGKMYAVDGNTFSTSMSANIIDLNSNGELISQSQPNEEEEDENG